MAKRRKWSINKTLVMPKVIRDSEFSEILADLGRLIYDEFCSQPGSNKSIDHSSHNQSVLEIASQNRKKVSV